MTNSDNIVRELIKDEYFHKLIIDPDDECIAFWTNWENEINERKGSISKAKQILLTFKFKTGTLSGEKKNLVWQGITHQIEKSSGSGKRKEKSAAKYYWYGVAAAITIIMTVIFANDVWWPQSSEKATAGVTVIEKVAPKGKISLFEFEDGTTVKLFSGSKIRYPIKFSGQIREVYLEGEGFFEVVKNVNKPFIVKTNNLVTTALGTSFNIRTYENSDRCDVSLVTGRVRVGKLEKADKVVDVVILEPGEEAVLANEKVVKQPFNIEEIVSWKEGYIYLENKSFEETIQILERWFDVSFVVRNGYKASGKKGTGKFRGQNLENILQVIGHSFGFTFKIEENKIFINL